MNRIATLSAIVVLQLALAAGARPQETRPSKAQMLTDDDVLSPRVAPSRPEQKEPRMNASGTTLQDSRSVLERALTKMAEVRSLRTRMQTSLPTGQREVLIESTKPDRIHVLSPEGEMIAIGGKFYLKSNGGWQVTSVPAGGGAQSDSGFDFRTFVKQMIDNSDVLITGYPLGDQTLDGVNTAAYEFEVTEGSQTGTILINVGKGDGYMRRMSISGGGIGINLWFTNINERFSIEPPM